MAVRNVSITMWGSPRGKWTDWYMDIKTLMNQLGHENTHIGIMSEHYTSGKILTVARKEKEIVTRITEGEIPSSFSCYALPKDYKVASFDYDIMCERNATYMSVIIKESDYNTANECLIISLMKKYICLEYGEIYSSIVSDMPLLYAETQDTDNLKSYVFIKKIG